MFRIGLLKLFLFAAILSCTHPTIVKQQTIGGNEHDILRSMCITKDGGFAICGWSYSDSSGDKLVNNHGIIYSDFWLIKFNNKGIIQWQKAIGGNGYELYGTVTSTNDGGFILGGASMSDISGDKTENCRGNDDMWIVKLDSSGNIQWDKTIGGSGLDECAFIRQTKDSCYVIAGSSTSNISGDKTENCRGDFDMWIIKLDSKGKILWNKTLGGNRWEFPGGLELTNDDGAIICGNSASDIGTDKSEANRGKRADFWIIKLDKDGKKIWDRTIGGNDDDMALGIKKTNDGNYLLTGFSSSNKSYEKSENSKGGDHDIWVVKIDSTGKIIWDKTIGGEGDDFSIGGANILLTLDGGYVICGDSNSKISGDKTDSCRGDYDFWIVKLNKTGKIEWDKTIGGANYENLVGVAEIKKNYFVVAGSSESGISGDKTDSSKGGKADYWIVYLNE
jgi:hypothetical protein